MTFVSVNPDGSLIGFYREDVHSTIPEGAVPISDEDWHTWHSTGADAYRWIDGKLTTYIPSVEEVQATIKDEQLRQAKIYFGQLMEKGFTYNGKSYQIDTQSQQKISTWGSRAADVLNNTPNAVWPADFGWIATDNSKVPMTAQQMFDFFQAATAYISSCILNLNNIKSKVPNNAFDATEGYPTAT